MIKRITPVYIEDIIGEVVAATSAANMAERGQPVKTLLETIKANETAALAHPSLIKSIRYSKSSYQELVENLAQADKGGGQFIFDKYPLIHLVQDVTVQRGRVVGSFGEANLNIVFVHQTVDTYKVEDRDAKVFKPVLWPIYYEFLHQLWRSGWTTGNDVGEYQHDVTKHSFWGTRQLSAGKNKLNDYVDAIEIQNLKIKFNFKNCP